MGKVQHHEKAFDDHTIQKLELFEEYARQWLPVFISQRSRWKAIEIYDLFAGPGTDAAGTPGSPLRLLAVAAEYSEQLARARRPVRFWFNDADRGKAERLQQATAARSGPGVQVTVTAAPFSEILPKLRGRLNVQDVPKLVLLDQFGVNAVNEQVFRMLANARLCDFLFFIAASTLHRFREDPAIQLKIPELSDHHRVVDAVVDLYRSWAPPGYFVGSFSLRHIGNVYGVIFGTGHPLGIEKFLQVAWKKDPDNGRAAFDIMRTGAPLGMPLLPGFQTSRKDAFDAELRKALKTRTLRDENDVFRFCVDRQMLGKHCKEVVNALRAEGCLRQTWHSPQADNWRAPRPIEYADATSTK